MFQEFFGFSSVPFSRGLPTSKLFVASGQEELKARLSHLTQLRGIGLITGEPVPPFRQRMILALRRSLEGLTNERKMTPILIVDEAHLLDQRMLEELRLLLNVRMDSQAAAALLLVGHSELRRTLRLSIHEAQVAADHRPLPPARFGSHRNRCVHPPPGHYRRLSRHSIV